MGVSASFWKKKCTLLCFLASLAAFGYDSLKKKLFSTFSSSRQVDLVRFELFRGDEDFEGDESELKKKSKIGEHEWQR